MSKNIFLHNDETARFFCFMLETYFQIWQMCILRLQHANRSWVEIKAIWLI